MHGTGAGIHMMRRTDFSAIDPRPIANNGLIVSASDGLRLECVSNSSHSGVGNITLPNGTTLPVNAFSGVWQSIVPYNRPGTVRFKTILTSSISVSDQGIYTCTISDSNENLLIFNVGLYPYGFNG